MISQLLQTLQAIGLDENEAKTYLALLQLGSGSVAGIARLSGIKRTSIYFILEKLENEGLIHKSKADTKTVYVAEQPDFLLKREEERIKALRSNMTHLADLSRRKSSRAKVLFYDSEEGFRQIWHTLFQSGAKEYLIMTDPRQMLHFVQKNYITGHIIKEKVERGIRSRQLVAFSSYAKEIVAKDSFENRVSKTLPAGYALPFTSIIFENNVVLISPLDENIIMIVESAAFAETERSKFEFLWQSLS